MKAKWSFAEQTTSLYCDISSVIPSVLIWKHHGWPRGRQNPCKDKVRVFLVFACLISVISKQCIDFYISLLILTKRDMINVHLTYNSIVAPATSASAIQLSKPVHWSSIAFSFSSSSFRQGLGSVRALQVLKRRVFKRLSGSVPKELLKQS